jgi:hypothetical protein
LTTRDFERSLILSIQIRFDLFQHSCHAGDNFKPC